MVSSRSVGSCKFFWYRLDEDERGYQYEAVFNRFKEASKIKIPPYRVWEILRVFTPPLHGLYHLDLSIRHKTLVVHRTGKHYCSIQTHHVSQWFLSDLCFR
jgi:hypothetical protein